MSLARTLLSGVSESAMVDTTAYDYSKCAAGTTEWVDTACESLFADVFTIDKAYHVADIVGEVQVIKEGADGEALLEGMISSGIEKLKTAFKKFWAKLKEFFNKVKRALMAFFMTGKKFIKEFKNDLNKKDAKGFTYKAFKYTITDGNKACDKVIDAAFDPVDVLSVAMAGTLEDVKKAIGETELISASEYQDKVVKKLSLGADDVSELADELNKLFRNGETEKEEFEDFESNSKDFMISTVETFEKKVKDIEKAEKEFEKLMNKVIKGLDKADSKEFGEEGYKAAQKASGYVSSLLTVAKVVPTVTSAVYKEMGSAFESILKSYLSFKPAKEGVEVDDEMEDDETATEGCGKKGTCESLLETAMRYI